MEEEKKSMRKKKREIANNKRAKISSVKYTNIHSSSSSSGSKTIQLKIHNVDVITSDSCCCTIESISFLPFFSCCFIFIYLNGSKHSGFYLVSFSNQQFFCFLFFFIGYSNRQLYTPNDRLYLIFRSS